MNTKKYKHLSYEDRCTIEEYLNFNYNFTQIGRRIKKDRTTIANEIKRHRFPRNQSSFYCNKLEKPPYVCNSCKERFNCKKRMFMYVHDVAYNDYKKVLITSRSHLKITNDEIIKINETISPLMIHKHHSINQVFIEHPECFNMSKSTFYKYIDIGLFKVRNIDLARKVKYKVKKEYDYERNHTNTKIKVGRFYTDFKDYIEYNPQCSIVEMDTVIGTKGGKGGKCLLTLLFRKYNFMLIYLLPYKQSTYVTEIFNNIKQILGIEEFKRLFEVILTDNGTEFSDPDSIEFDIETGEKVCSIFYCDPNCSWQKGSIEKNHEFIRYILPKGTSFAFLTQEKCYKLASHINSIPRISLNNLSPYEVAFNMLGEENMNKFQIKKINYEDIDLTSKLLKD